MESQNYMQFNSSHSHEPDQAILQSYRKQSKFSRLLPVWLNRFVQQGSRSIIRQQDIFEIRQDETAEVLGQNFLDFFRDIHHVQCSKLLQVIWKQFKSILLIILLYDWIILFLFKLGMFITLVTNPVVTNLIIQLFDQTSNIPLYLETIMIFILWMLSFMFFMSATSFYEKMLKAKLKTSLSFYLLDSLYKKAYPLPPIGELTTVLQLDITQITQIISSAATLVIIPFQLIGSIYVYYNLVGEPAIVGISTTLINLLLCLLYGNIYSKYQKQIMQSRDQRVKGIEELLNGIKTIKQNGYYDLFTNRIRNKRENEMKDIKKQNYLLATITFIFSLLPICVLFLTFSIYNNFSLKLILLIQQSYFQVSLVVNTIPGTLSEILLAITSMNRFTKYMNFKSTNILQIQNQNQTNQITISNGQFKWNAQPSEDKEQSPNQVDEMEDQSSFELKDINLSINRGETVLIVGSNGSGKSALLYALLGEMQQIGDTKVSVNGSVSFAAQEPWIVQASVLENIVLDNELNVERFVKSVEMAQLYYDLEMMPAGHNTDIGEKGQTLSGGQKKRLHLARSLYLEKDIYLLDNPCSALDHSTSQKLIDALRKQLSNKTLIITSNSTEYWEFVDRIVYLEEGKIKFNGTYMEFKKQAESRTYLERQKSEYDLDEIKVRSLESQGETEIPQLIFDQFDQKSIKLVNDEDRALGSINKEVFGSIYNLYGNKTTFIIAGILSMISMTLIITQQTQMTYITQASNSDETTDDERQAATTSFLFIYPLCGVIAAVFTFITSLYLAKKGAQASIQLHKEITNNLLKGSVQKFFNLILTSRIKNRLTLDIYQFDMDTPRQLANIYSSLFNLLANLLACIALASPKAYPVLGFYIYFEIKYTIKYLQVILQVNRLQSISKSPIVNRLSEITSGAVYLRNCSNLNIQQKQNTNLINMNQKLNICIAALDNWYIIVIEIFMFLMYIIVITFTYFDKSISKEAGTISMYLALGVGQTFLFTMINIEQFYGENTSLERCLYLAKHISREDENELPDTSSQIETEQKNNKMTEMECIQKPSLNILKLNNINIKYREDLSLMVKDIELEIREKEKLAIIGRTGCGKTTLIQTITRLIEPFSGTISINGLDYKNIGINKTRLNFCVVLQDPFVFEGSIKQNIDPTDQYSPQEILNQLQTYGFINDNPELDIVETIMNNMDFYIQPNGQNLSLGEKQLIVMCRTVLQRKKIVILDECTGNLDQKYGKLINLMLSLYLKDKTVIGVTHKLDQLELFDSVVLINQGQLIAKGDKDYVIQEYLKQFK